MGQRCSRRRSDKIAGNTLDLQPDAGSDSRCHSPNGYDAVDEAEDGEEVALVVAMHEYVARSINELSFSKGDLLEVLDKTSSEWWLARIPKSRTKAYIPVPFTASSSSLESQDWYFGDIPRVQAEQLLLNSVNSAGSFLIRVNQSGNGFALSVAVNDFRTDRIKVKHYRIVVTDAGHYYFPGCDKVFHTLNDLVDHYQHTNDVEISQYMSHPCRRHRPNITVLPPPEDRFEVDPQAIWIGQQIGHGSYGDVYMGTLNNLPVAIKMLREGCMTHDQFLQEARIMKDLNHENIISLYAVCTHHKPVLIVTEFMSCGSLLDMLRSPAGDDLALPQHLYIATQVASGMAYLEGKHLIHRDLAARNVLLGPSLQCKVADFGLARICMNEYNPTSDVRFPVKWTAPEALLRGRFSIKSDVWSFGILVIEIVTGGAVPYPGMSNQELTEKLQQNYRMPRPNSCDERLFEEVEKCWDKIPSRRPTFSHLHHFLNDYEVLVSGAYYGEQELQEFQVIPPQQTGARGHINQVLPSPFSHPHRW